MKIFESTVTKLRISEVDGLDPITVIFEDFGPAQGKFIIECWGECWSHFWGAMGSGSTVKDFFLSCDNDYIASKCLGNTRVIDYDQVSEKIEGIVTNEIELLEYEEELREHYGDDWRSSLPECKSDKYNYLCKILDAVKAALRDGK